MLHLDRKQTFFRAKQKDLVLIKKKERLGLCMSNGNITNQMKATAEPAYPNSLNRGFNYDY